jgi:hypothetical protein
VQRFNYPGTNFGEDKSSYCWLCLLSICAVSIPVRSSLFGLMICLMIALSACSRENPPIDAGGVSELFSECYSNDLAPVSRSIFDSLGSNDLNSGDMSVSELRRRSSELMSSAYNDAAICLSKLPPVKRNCEALDSCFEAFIDRKL